MPISIQVQIKDAELKAVLAKIDERLKNRQGLYKAWGLEWLKWSNMNFGREGSPKWHPLAASTIAGRRQGRGKGGAKILQDRGNLRNSAVYNPNGADLRIGYSDKKAPWHHFGTRARIIRPKTKMTRTGGRGQPIRTSGGLLRFFGPDGKIRFARFVRHPGLPRRPLLPTTMQVLNEMRIVEIAKRYLFERLKK